METKKAKKQEEKFENFMFYKNLTVGHEFNIGKDKYEVISCDKEKSSGPEFVFYNIKAKKL